jgi:hypothetical protein
VSQRLWTRAGVMAVAGHLGYELLAGVSVPMASRLGIKTAVTGYAAATAALYHAAGHVPPSRGHRRFAVLNGLFASAVISHFTSWPRTTRAGLPWLTECEGLTGEVIGPYNLLLHGSAVAAVAGVVENRRAWPWFVTTVAVVVPLLRRETDREFQRLLAQAAQTPRWWNRRLASRAAHAPVR